MDARRYAAATRGEAGAEGPRRGPRRRRGRPGEPRGPGCGRAGGRLRSAPQCREGAPSAGRCPGDRGEGASIKAPR